MDREEMTLEEVIETLQVWISTADDEYDREEHGRVCGLKEALHEIKKIKPCTDVISRQAALEQTYKWSKDEFLRVTNPFDYLRKRILSLPSVSTEKKGHWIIVDDCEKFIAKCSKCGRIEDSRMINKYPYCHCGAMMVKQQEREG